MKATLEFYGNGHTAVTLTGETAAEKAILAVIAEGMTKKWVVNSPKDYRAGGVSEVRLIEMTEPSVPFQPKETP